MGQELQRHTPGTVARQADPSWPTVAGTTVRLWLDRHYRRRPGRRRLVILASALLAMALGRRRDAGLHSAGIQSVPGAGRRRGLERAAGGGGRPPSGGGLGRPGGSQQHLRGLRHGDVQRAEKAISRRPSCCSCSRRLAPARRAACGGDTGDQESVRHPPGHRLRAAGHRQLRLRAGRARCPLHRAGRERGVRVPARDGPEEHAFPPASSWRPTSTSRHPRPRGKPFWPVRSIRVLAITLSALANLMPLHLITFDDLSPGASAGRAVAWR